MLAITQDAGTRLQEMIDDLTKPEDTETAVRILLGDQGVEMRLDQPRAGDSTIEHKGKTVLLLEDKVSQALDARTLKLEDTERGQAFVFK